MLHSIDDFFAKFDTDTSNTLLVLVAGLDDARHRRDPAQGRGRRVGPRPPRRRSTASA